MQHYKATIITIGNELLIGQVIDTNSAWIAQKLQALGIQIHRRTAVGDQLESILAILESAIISSDMVIVTGGLGPTDDDLTVAAFCKFFGCKLVENQEVLLHLEQLFAKRNRPFTERNKQQALVPDCCRVLFNQVGTAPGMWFDKKSKVIISLPGVPYEMEHIMETQALPELAKRFSGGAIVHEHIITAGEGESFIADALQEIETNLPPHIELAYLPGFGMVRLRLTASGRDKEALLLETRAIKNEIISRIQYCVVGEEDESLMQIVSNALVAKNLSIAVAESCTGGQLASDFTNIPGSSAYFLGGVVAYSNHAKQVLLQVPAPLFETVGAISVEVVDAMAMGVAKNFKADIGIGISGILGPHGGTPEKPVGTVCVAISIKDKIIHKRFTFHGSRMVNKHLTLQHTLLLLIKALKDVA